MNHVQKYYWIIDHPKLTKYGGQAVIELTPHIVNPVNETIELDDNLNTACRWWVELSYEGEDFQEDGCLIHDWDCDTGGATAEEAIENLHTLVKNKFGDY